MILNLAQILFIYISYINALCPFAGSYNKPVQFQVDYNSTKEECYEYFLGTLFRKQKMLLILSNNILNCEKKDNILIYDGNRNLVNDYCSNFAKTKFHFQYFMVEDYFMILEFRAKSNEKLSSLVNFILVDLDSLKTTTSTPTTTTTQTTTISDDIIIIDFPEETTTKIALTESTTTSPYFPDYSICGVPKIKPRQNSERIIGGVEAIPNSWPWQIYISDGQHFCGASLLNNQWILTAAHCVISRFWKAYLGMHDIRFANDLRAIRVSKIFKYPNYTTSSYKNDIALFKLQTPVNFTDFIKPICLPNSFIANPGKEATVTGWGKITNYGNLPSKLQQVTISIKPKSECSFFNLDETQICAGTTDLGNEKDSCQGDSGGPLVVKEGNNYVLAGVVSYGRQFCDGYGVYTSVFSYLDWIKSTVSTN